MNVERMIRLRECLIQSKLDFNMDDWATCDFNGCITAACAGGTYVLMNPGCGLELKEGWPAARQFKIVESGTIWEDYQALARHFDIDVVISKHIFSPFEYSSYYVKVTPKMVIGRIESLLAEHLALFPELGIPEWLSKAVELRRLQGGRESDIDE